jgi:hypothetical protein
MFGSGLPVLSASFPAIHELVLDGVNGLVFKSSKELEDHLGRIFHIPLHVSDASEKQISEANVFLHEPTSPEASCSSGSLHKVVSDASHVTNSSGSIVSRDAVNAAGLMSEGFEGALETDTDGDDFVHVRRTMESSNDNEMKLLPRSGSGEKHKNNCFPQSLSSQPQVLLAEDNYEELKKLWVGVKGIKSWDENWNLTMEPIVKSLLEKDSRTISYGFLIVNFVIACTFLEIIKHRF